MFYEHIINVSLATTGFLAITYNRNQKTIWLRLIKATECERASTEGLIKSVQAVTGRTVFLQVPNNQNDYDENS